MAAAANLKIAKIAILQQQIDRASREIWHDYAKWVS